MDVRLSISRSELAAIAGGLAIAAKGTDDSEERAYCQGASTAIRELMEVEGKDKPEVIVARVRIRRMEDADD